MSCNHPGLVATAAAVLVGAACGAADGPVAPVEDAGAGDGAVELITAGWTLGPGDEGFVCARRTLTEDLYIASFRPAQPRGTHHVAAAFGPPEEPDGEFVCDPDEGGASEAVLFAAGVGTDDFFFPDGVALRVPAGQQITLNLHLYNVGDSPLSGRSGMFVDTLAAADVVQNASLLLPGAEAPSMPPSTAPVTLTSDCTFLADTTILDLWPHMHRIGRRMAVTLDDTPLLDEPYSFEEQVHYPMTAAAGAGDVLRFTCEWLNDTGAFVEPGNSSDTEMCVLGMYLVSDSSSPAECEGL